MKLVHDQNGLMTKDLFEPQNTERQPAKLTLPWREMLGIAALLVWLASIGWLDDFVTEITSPNFTSHAMGLPIAWIIIWNAWLLVAGLAAIPAVVLLSGLKTRIPPSVGRSVRVAVYGIVGMSMCAWTGLEIGSGIMPDLDQPDAWSLLGLVFLPQIAGSVFGTIAIAALAWANR